MGPEEYEEEKGQMVIVQAEINLASKTKGSIDVDLWYTGTYEFI